MSDNPQFTFHSPAHQAEIDYGSDTQGLDTFNGYWNDNLRRWTEQSIMGNPWSNQYDDNRNFYFNPLETAIPANPTVAAITWLPFPNRLKNFFTAPQMAGYKLSSLPAGWTDMTTAVYYTLADGGSVLDPQGNSVTVGQVKVPSAFCPELGWSDPRTFINYTPSGSRGWLDEYCEWSIKYDDDGQIRQVMFTCENPAYWLTLWKQNPDTVLRLYQQYISPAVQREDLYLRDTNNNPVLDPLTGDYAYDVTNKWNSWTKTLPNQGGAMHLTSGPNTLSAEIYLAAAASIQRTVGNSNAQNLICCSQYGRSFRNSDPHIGQQANQVATAGAGKFISLTDPVGLYIQQPSFALWQLPSGYQAQDCWTIQRGVLGNSAQQGMDSILHAVFTVPEGLKANQISIYEPTLGHYMPLIWAGQLANTFHIALRATAIPATTTQKARDCVVGLRNSKVQPWPVQFVPYDCFVANSVTDLTPSLKPGTTVKMALVVQGGLQNAQIDFSPADGLTVSQVEFIPGQSGAPGQTSGGTAEVYVFELSVAADAQPGDRGVRVTNLDNPIPEGGLPFAPGLLNIG